MLPKQEPQVPVQLRSEYICDGYWLVSKCASRKRLVSLCLHNSAPLEACTTCVSLFGGPMFNTCVERRRSSRAQNSLSRTKIKIVQNLSHMSAQASQPTHFEVLGPQVFNWKTFGNRGKTVGNRGLLERILERYGSWFLVRKGLQST